MFGYNHKYFSTNLLRSLSYAIKESIINSKNIDEETQDAQIDTLDNRELGNFETGEVSSGGKSSHGNLDTKLIKAKTNLQQK